MHSAIRCLVSVGLLIFSASTVQAGDPLKGRGIYAEHCHVCHGAEGKPTIEGVPNFSLGEGLMKSDPELAKVIKRGKGVMPGYDALLEETEILNVIAYIRGFF